MKPILKFAAFILLTGLLFFMSCQKEIPCENCRSVNKPPIANAGPDQTIMLPIDSIKLDGSLSSDPDGTISSFQWTKISGPASFAIITASAAITSAKQLVMGAYQFELKVTDNGGQSAKDTMQITVNDPAQPNRPPVANAGADQTITLPTNSVTINGSSSADPDNNITSYSWTKISGPATFYIVNPNIVQTQVIGLINGAYQFELKVTDAGGLFTKDTIQVTVIADPTACNDNGRPLVNAQLTAIGTLSKPRIYMAVASAGSKIVFAGGYNTPDCPECFGSKRVDIYDMVTQTWSTAELSVGRWGIAAVAAGNKIFFAGGEFGDGAFDTYYSTVDIYDVSTNTWSVASLSVPRSKIAAAVVGNKVFFAGGEENSDYATSNIVDIYDLSEDTWSTNWLYERRAHISAVTVQNKIYFAGGHIDDRWYATPSGWIDIYDNITNSWSTSSLSQPMGFIAGIAVANKIYWTEGCKVEIKDVNTGSSSMTHLSAPKHWYIDFGENAVVKDNKIVFLGHNSDGTGTDKIDIYDIATNTWSIGILPVNINGASIISVNNTIYVAGGYLNDARSSQVWKLEF